MKTEFKGKKGKKEADEFFKKNKYNILGVYELTDGTKIVNYKIENDIWHEYIPNNNDSLYFLIKVS